jgi:L-rhamnose mutarotase
MRIIVENNCKSDIKTIQSFFENDNDINVSLTNNNFVFDFSQLNVTKYKKNHNVVYNEFLDKIANIKSYGLKNGKRVFNNYNSERKVSNRLKKVEKRLGYKEFFKEFSKTNNTIPAVWLDKVICGDSYKILKQLPDNCIDVVITSPPYNFGIGYNQHDDTKK